MIPISELYQDVAEQLLTTANSEPSFDTFNRFSKLAELDLLDWLTGRLQRTTVPEIYSSQKDRDYVSPFVAKYQTSVQNGMIARPADYYLFNDLYLVGSPGDNTQGCVSEDEEYPTDVCDTEVIILDSDQFNVRCNTYIKGLQPSLKKPIAKQVGNNFEFKPKDCGVARLEYIRYPKYAIIVPKLDPQYNIEVIDTALSSNYEWDDKARGLLVWFIVDRFANRTANQSMKEFNIATVNNPEK